MQVSNILTVKKLVTVNSKFNSINNTEQKSPSIKIFQELKRSFNNPIPIQILEFNLHFRLTAHELIKKHIL